MAIYKPSGSALPSDDILKRCWNENPNGGGYCIAHNGIVSGSKGYMSFKRFLSVLHKNINADMPALIHFRLATHGSINGSATHPFPLSRSENALNALSWESDCGIIHNGIVPGYGDSIKGKISDTQHYIKDFLAIDFIRNRLQTSKIQKLVENMSFSKWAFLYGSGETVLIGTWINDNGIWYSNTGYLPSKWNDTFVENITEYIVADIPCPACYSQETWIDDDVELCAVCGLCRFCETEPCVCYDTEPSERISY